MNRPATAAAAALIGLCAAGPAAALTLEIAGTFDTTPVPLLAGRSFLASVTYDPTAPLPDATGPSSLRRTTHVLDAAAASFSIDGSEGVLLSLDAVVTQALASPRVDSLSLRFLLPGFDAGFTTFDPVRDGFDFTPLAETAIEYGHFYVNIVMPPTTLGSGAIPAAELMQAEATSVGVQVRYCTTPRGTFSCTINSASVLDVAIRQFDEGAGDGAGTGGEAAVPVPAAGGLLAAALGMLALARRRRAG